jgi:DNA topoisomerase IB
VGLAISAPAASGASRTRAITRVVAEVAGYLGNAPAVTRASNIDPRVVQLYEKGRTIAGTLDDLGRDCDFGELATRGRAERAVLQLLS